MRFVGGSVEGMWLDGRGRGIQKQTLLQTSIMMLHEALETRILDHQYEKLFTPIYRAHVLTCNDKSKIH